MRGSLFGQSSRFDENTNYNPSPHDYQEIENVPDINNKKTSPKFSFSIENRQKSKLQNFPGPDKQNPLDSIKNQSPAICQKFGSSPKNPSNSKNNLPGPNSYEVADAQQKINYTNHSYSIIGSSEYKPSKNFPGPGEYEIGDTLGKITTSFGVDKKINQVQKPSIDIGPGDYQVSQSQNSKMSKDPIQSFGTSKSRDELQKNNQPGPGQYSYDLNNFVKYEKYEINDYKYKFRPDRSKSVNNSLKSKNGKVLLLNKQENSSKKIYSNYENLPLSNKNKSDISDSQKNYKPIIHLSSHILNNSNEDKESYLLAKLSMDINNRKYQKSNRRHFQANPNKRDLND